MGLWKRGDWYWLDACVHGHRFREPLGTTDWRVAKRLERERIEQLLNKASVPSASSLTYAAMDVEAAIAAYAEERWAQVSARMADYWLENARPLKEFFKDTKLRQITPAQLAASQNARTKVGRAPKTINGELSGVAPDLEASQALVPLRGRVQAAAKPQAAGRSRAHRSASAAAVRRGSNEAAVAVRIRGGDPVLLLRHARMRDQAAEVGTYRFCQSPAPRAAVKDAGGWRSPTLNATCLRVLQELYEQAAKLGFTAPSHFVFPWHGRNKRLDPTKHMTSWRTAWRSGAEGGRTIARAVLRRAPYGDHDTGGKGTSRLGDPGTSGPCRARDDENVQPHPPAGA
jgi:hypothetical protein